VFYTLFDCGIGRIGRKMMPLPEDLIDGDPDLEFLFE
jgi:hypothetical protein